ncbi:unnamed protein product [Paramecium primaurelia]|uniref:Uncharacterized protein n=1 Tax=Paramecium primaurelia TaxID=5886 RepID=A0A8S1PLH6_PARPR|nr:unnamed protein product [Paramecium primaurelia]
MIINITPDETKSFRCFQQQKVQVVVQEEQEVFERQEDLLQILSNVNQINIIDDDDSSSIFKKLLDMLKKEQIKDCVAYLQSFKYQDQKEKEQIKKIIHILKNIKDREFNQKDYSSEPLEEIKKDLIKKLQGNKSMIELLKFLIMLTSIDDQFISCGSNSLHMLVMMKVDVRNQSFENIRMKNTSLISGNFVRCNLNGSEFENVDISGVNFNGAQMFNCQWKNIKVHELNRLDGHSNCVRSVCFSPDRNTLASGSYDYSIRLWDVKTGQQKAKLDGHTSTVYSVCSLLMEIHQLLVVVISLSVFGMSKQDKKLNPLTKTTKIFLPNLRFHSNNIDIFSKEPPIISLKTLYPNRQYFKHKEHQF